LLIKPNEIAQHLVCLSMDDLAASFRPNKSSNRARRHQQLGLVKSLGLVRVSNLESLKKVVLTPKTSQRFRFRLVPWVNGVKWRET
jgi:hypothetical protein